MLNNELILLFSISFLSSTLLPGGSEAYLIWLSLESTHPTIQLLIVATIGNTLGGMTNWFIGRYLHSKIISKIQSKQFKFLHANNAIKKYGYPILLLSWLPIIGDILCLFAGWYKLNALKSLIFILVGKFLRYTFIIYIVQMVGN